MIFENQIDVQQEFLGAATNLLYLHLKHSQTTLNIVEKVIEVGELNEGNISAAAGK